METPPITIRQADPEDLVRLESLLERDGLPTEDVRSKPECFFTASADGTFVAAGGIERYGSDGLLRSVVVPESCRGEGYGTALCEELEERARENGVGTLYLLTTTAPGFFERRGYGRIAREDAPSTIQETTEFSELCPDSATCMRKEIR